MSWFKFLGRGAVGPFSGFRWPAPERGDGAGGWVEETRHLEPCRVGLHVCRPGDLPFWLFEELYAVEVDGPVVEHDSFVLARRARLLRRVDAWAQDSASRFSRDCAWRVRDLAAHALRESGRSQDADRLAGCTTIAELGRAAGRVADDDAGSGPLVGYAVDAATFASAARREPQWAAPAVTSAFVAAAAARVAGGPDDGEAALSAERARQGRWLVDHVLAL